jgi:hypothetical protein
MAFIGRVSRPAVERIIEQHAGVELGEIVPVHAGQAERCRQQPGRLGRKVMTVGVGAADDRRQPLERRGAKIELL